MLVNRQIEVSANGCALDKREVTLGVRIEGRRKAVGISQAELARRVGVRQSTINSLINGESRSSRSIVRIAFVLGTTPAYLTGETDDPDEGAPPPPPAPRVQHVSLPVALPSELALTAAFRGLLLGSEGMGTDELAHELATQLPIVLRQAAAALPSVPTVDPLLHREAEEAPASEHLADLRVPRT